MSKKYYLSSDHYVKVLLTTKWLSKLRKHLLVKRKLATLIIQLFLSSAKIWSSNSSSCSGCSWSGSRCGCYLDLLSSLQLLYPGTVKNLLDWLSRALDLSDTRGASALQDKFVTVSSVANAGHDQLFAIYKDLLPFIRTQVVGDFTAARVNDSAWADGKLVLEETVLNSLEKQAEDLVNAIK